MSPALSRVLDARDLAALLERAALRGVVSWWREVTRTVRPGTTVLDALQLSSDRSGLEAFLVEAGLLGEASR